jgi:hypothetical protein
MQHLINKAIPSSGKNMKEGKPVTSEVSRPTRASRYQQHCESMCVGRNGVLNCNTEGIINGGGGKMSGSSQSPLNSSLSPAGGGKRSDATNIGIKLKNSLSSSRESTPTLLRLSRSATPTPLLQSVVLKGNPISEEAGDQLRYTLIQKVQQQHKQRQHLAVLAEASNLSTMGTTPAGKVNIYQNI